jgi:hypothetical protein
MFSGRSEEVSTRAVDANNNPVALGLSGSWPSSLTLTRDGLILNRGDFIQRGCKGGETVVLWCGGDE